jgi:cell division septation protein DedD
VSIKISQLQLSVEDALFKFFGYTDEDGFYQLNAENQDYLLFITHKGYSPLQLRINIAQNQDTYLVELIPRSDCGELSGTVQPAAKNTAIAGAAVNIKDQRGRLLKTTYSDNLGNFTVCLPCNEAYDIIIESEGYQRLQERVFLSANCIDLPQDVVLYLPSDRPRAQPEYTPARPDTRIAEAEPDNRPTTTAANQQRNTAASPFRTVGNEAAFFVIAGTFSRRSNAESRLAEVKAAGFNDAQIVKLSDSGYFAVCLGNLDSRGAAAALRQRFESVTQINAYVRDEPF